MFESEDEVGELQALIDRTFARANPHLVKIVKPERRFMRIEPSSMWAYAFHPENFRE